MNIYRTVYIGGTGEITEKKSRFIATIQPVETEENALAFIDDMKKKYWDASHNCSAYIIGTSNQLERCSDDGEPSKTAGRPMLDILSGEHLTNTIAVVTRYFGGTLLGTGGLIRAYQAAVKEGLKKCTIIEKQLLTRLCIKTDYTGLGKLQYYAASDNIPITNTEYTDNVTVYLMTDSIQTGILTKRMLEATGGRAVITSLGQKYCAYVNGIFQIFE